MNEKGRRARNDNVASKNVEVNKFAGRRNQSAMRDSRGKGRIGVGIDAKVGKKIGSDKRIWSRAHNNAHEAIATFDNAFFRGDNRGTIHRFKYKTSFVFVVAQNGTKRFQSRYPRMVF